MRPRPPRSALLPDTALFRSLRNPAAFCKVVGLRPTPGRVPTWPAAMGWSQMSVQGPVGRTVADVALVLSAIAGPDRRVAESPCPPPAPVLAPAPPQRAPQAAGSAPGPLRGAGGGAT